MISICHTVMVKPGKGREFDQVLGSTVSKSRMLEECQSFTFNRLYKRNDQYFIYAEWYNSDFLKKFILSDLFNLIISAISVLCFSHEIEIAKGQTKISITSTNMSDKNYKKQLQDKLTAELAKFDASK